MLPDWFQSIGVLGEALGLLGTVLSFLGATGIVLFLVSLLLLALVGAISPLPKMVNYLAIVGFVTCLAFLGVEGFGALPDRLGAIRGYLIFMLAPVVAVFGLRALLTMLFGRQRSATRRLEEAVNELTEQVASLRRENRGHENDTRYMIEAKAREPRLLKKLD